jgi:hypothetical protein
VRKVPIPAEVYLLADKREHWFIVFNLFAGRGFFYISAEAFWAGCGRQTAKLGG